MSSLLEGDAKDFMEMPGFGEMGTWNAFLTVYVEATTAR